MTTAEAVNSGEQAESPVLPGYGRSTLADFSQSLLASLAVPGAVNALGLPAVSRACLLVVDGLGWDLLRSRAAAAPFMSGLAETGCWLTAGFPSTTATSLSSLGTALPPGQHGLLGYQVRVPSTGRLINALRWAEGVDPVQWQPHATIFERAAAAGIGAFRIASGAYRHSGLSLATMRGADYRPAETAGALVACAAAALAERPRALAMVYSGDLDATGHVAGWGSAAWRYQLRQIDLLAEQLAGAVPAGTALYITGDHGMVDVPPDTRVDADGVPALRHGVALLGGEPRARHVYARPGAAADVLAAWQDTLGDTAWIASRDEAIEAGWFGPVDRRVSDRIGDVIAAARGQSAVVATAAEPRESALIGMHGSLTAGDQRVPLLSHIA